MYRKVAVLLAFAGLAHTVQAQAPGRVPRSLAAGLAEKLTTPPLLPYMPGATQTPVAMQSQPTRTPPPPQTAPTAAPATTTRTSATTQAPAGTRPAAAQAPAGPPTLPATPPARNAGHLGHDGHGAPPRANVGCCPGGACSPGGACCAGGACCPGGTCNAGGACCPDGGCCSDCPRSRFYVFGEYLYLTARNADVAFGQVRDGVTVLAVPRGPVGVADPAYHSGARVGAGAALSCDSFIQGSFTWYESRSSDSLIAPPGRLVHSLTTFPATFNVAADSLTATSNYDIDFRFVDLDFKHNLCCCGGGSLRYLLGARYAHLDQDFLGTYTILGTTTVTTNIRFDGGGPRAGLEGDYAIGKGVFTYGSGIASLLAGHFNANYVQRNVFVGTQVNTEYGDDRIVPVLELEAGLGWRSPNDRIIVRAGYYVAGWGNTLTTPAWIQGVRNTNFTTNSDNLRDTLTFDGFVARVELRY